MQSLLNTDRIYEVIFEYAARIGSEQDPDALLALNANLARDLVGAERCSIWLADVGKGELWTKVAHGVDEIRIPIGQGLVGASHQSNESILVNDASSDPRFLSRMDLASGYVTKSVAVLPLRNQEGQSLGALQVLNKPGGFAQSDLRLLRLAASYTASVIVHQALRREAAAAQLIYRELEIARDVQQHLFPQTLPVISTLDCAALCRPANAVGGDYYDFIELSGGRLAFTLGDVSGKGVPAAVLMASLQSAFRSLIVGALPSLASLLSEFNLSVHNTSTSNRYATLFCGTYDPNERQLIYVNAGHVPPLLLRASGELVRLCDGGPPLGLFKDAIYSQTVVTLSPGDVLLCCSDGISEAENVEGEMLDEEQIGRILAGCAGLNAAEIVDKVVSAVDQYTRNTEQADDMTVTVLRVS